MPAEFAVFAMPLALLIAGSSAYGSLTTYYGGAVGPILFGSGYVDQKTWWTIGAILVAYNLVVYMTLGLAYWKIIGLYQQQGIIIPFPTRTVNLAQVTQFEESRLK